VWDRSLPVLRRGPNADSGHVTKPHPSLGLFARLDSISLLVIIMVFAVLVVLDDPRTIIGTRYGSRGRGGAWYVPRSSGSLSDGSHETSDS